MSDDTPKAPTIDPDVLVRSARLVDEHGRVLDRVAFSPGQDVWLRFTHSAVASWIEFLDQHEAMVFRIPCVPAAEGDIVMACASEPAQGGTIAVTVSPPLR